MEDKKTNYTLIGDTIHIEHVGSSIGSSGIPSHDVNTLLQQNSQLMKDLIWAIGQIKTKNVLLKAYKKSGRKN